MLDGAPASLASYLQQNVDSENIESVNVMPGSSQVDMPTANAAAGTLDERTITPSEKRGGSVDFSYGTNNFSREFIRLQSGYIGHSGVRTYVSFSNAHARQWMGGGINERKHVDFGLQKDFDNGSFIKLFTSWHNSMFTIDNYATASEFYDYKHNGVGYNRSNSQAAGGNYWKGNLDSWNQFFVSAPVHVVVNKKLDFDMTPYLSTGFGWDGSSAGTVGATSACSGGCYYNNGTQAASNQLLSTYYAQGWSPDVAWWPRSTTGSTAITALRLGTGMKTTRFPSSRPPWRPWLQAVTPRPTIRLPCCTTWMGKNWSARSIPVMS